MTDAARATSLLNELCSGQSSAASDLLPLVYDELRRVAASLLSGERREHTLQPTALVHEAWMRLIDQQCVRVDDEEAHRRFVGLGARAMRQVLVDHARRVGREKRGGELERVTLPVDLPIAMSDPAVMLDLEAILDDLAGRSERLAKLVELRIFGGLSVREAAEVLEMSLTTAKSDWAMARGILTGALRDRERGRRG